MFYVYRHIRLDLDTPFYVGKGKDNRAFSKDRNNLYWHNIVKKAGIRVEIVKHFINEKEAFAFERCLIEVYKRFNMCEANFTSGGEGASGRIITEEFKQKISFANLGSKNGMFGKYKELNPSYGSGYKVKCLNNNKVYISSLEAQKDLGIVNVIKVARGIREESAGYLFTFVDEDLKKIAHEKRLVRMNKNKRLNKDTIKLVNIYEIEIRMEINENVK